MAATVYPLSGLLFCGNCGGPMTGRTTNASRKAKWRKETYTCSNGAERRGCKLFSLRLDRFEPIVFQALRERLLPDLAGRDLREAIEQLVHERLSATSPLAVDVGKLRTQLADLDARIEQGVENLGRLKGKTADLLAAKVDAWAEEAERLREELAREEAEEAKGSPQADQLVESALALAEELSAVGSDSPPRLRRALFRKVVQRLEVSFETTMVGRRRRHLPTGGLLSLVDDPSITVIDQAPRAGP